VFLWLLLQRQRQHQLRQAAPAERIPSGLRLKSERVHAYRSADEEMRKNRSLVARQLAIHMPAADVLTPPARN
jgi:hypothetical protein